MTRVNELEAWLKVLRQCAACQVNFDNWEARAKSSSRPDEIAKMNAEYDESRREQTEAETALEALIIKTRAEAPAALEEWISKHEAYEPHAEWAELRAGKRNLLYEFGRWPSDRERYVRIFGTEP